MAPPDAAVAKEFRFSVVMYGGVSLAIYMNGVAQELLHLVRSTARTESDDQFRFCVPSGPGDPRPGALRSTEPIYRRLARELNDAGGDDVRFIVDVISGTSAGGINGIFLAKALTDDSLSFDALQKLWIDEGALERLLNDNQTRKLTKLPNQESPRSLLCSDRMYIELLDALRAMKPPGNPGKPLCQEIDLFVTTTDITGRVVPLRLADMLVWERKYKEDFHFVYNQTRNHNDLAEGNDPFVAFVARCTSSFPFAFEPMQLSKVQELQNTEAWPDVPKVDEATIAEWEAKFFDNTEQVSTGPNRTRAFGDGGYLNNKPFSFVVDMLGRHSSSFPTERKLIYVEPTPEHPEQEGGTDVTAAARNQNAPNALVNSFDALVKLPGYQPIHDDLQRVIERNRLVRKVTELSAVITSTIQERVGEAAERKKGDGLDLSVGDFSYLVLRVYSTTDELARVMSEWFGFAKSSSFYYAIRCLVRAWREANYEDMIVNKVAGRMARREALVSAYISFLTAFDIDYEKRKYRFIRQQINVFYCFDGPAKERLKNGFQVSENELDDQEFRKAFQQTLGDLKKPFDDASRVIGHAQRQIRPFNKPNIGDEATIRLFGSQEKVDQAANLFECFQKLENAASQFRPNGHAADQEQQLGADVEARQAGGPVAVQGGEPAASAKSADGKPASGLRVVEYVLGVRERDESRKYASVEADQDEGYVKRAKHVIQNEHALTRAVQDTANAISAVLRGAINEAGKLAAGVEAVRDDSRKRFSDAGRTSPAARGMQLAIRLVGFFASNYQLFDTALFPLLYDTDVGTPEPISIIRVSPEDATALYDQTVPGRAQKLAGASLAHFGAFLDRSFRTNDILWGRLDGAERIIRALLGTDKNKKRALELIGEAQFIIIQDFLRDRQGELAGLIYQIAKSLNPAPAEPAGWFATMLATIRARRAKRTVMKDGRAIFQNMDDAKVLAIRECVQSAIATLPNQNFAQAVDGYLTAEKIRNYLGQEPPTREPDRRTTLESITRTVRIMGGILQTLGKETEAAGGMLIRAGGALWWLVQAAIPGGLTGHFVGKIFAALFWFEIVMVLGGTLFNQAVQSVGLKLLFFTTLVWLAKDAFQRYLRRGSRGLRVTGVLAALALLIGLGIWAAMLLYPKH